MVGIAAIADLKGASAFVSVAQDRVKWRSEIAMPD